MEGEILGIFYKHKTQLRKTVSKIKLSQKDTMLMKEKKETLENEYVFRRKICLHEKHSDHNFF